MSVARSIVRLLGTDETTGVTIANNASSAGSENDLLGNNTSEGNGKLFLKYTATGTGGSIDVYLFSSTVTGQSYQDQAPIFLSVAPINGTQKIYLGDVKLSRFMTGQVNDNNIGVSLTNVTLTLETFVES